MIKNTLFLTALYGALAVILGALGAHALKDTMNPTELANYKTAVFYQIIHVLAILGISAYPQINRRMKTMISHTFLTGITLFSGSLYLISLHLVNAKSIWWVTPLGGIFLILGWFMAAFAFFKIGKY